MTGASHCIGERDGRKDGGKREGWRGRTYRMEWDCGWKTTRGLRAGIVCKERMVIGDWHEFGAPLFDQSVSYAYDGY